MFPVLGHSQVWQCCLIPVHQLVRQAVDCCPFNTSVPLQLYLYRLRMLQYTSDSTASSAQWHIQSLRATPLVMWSTLILAASSGVVLGLWGSWLLTPKKICRTGQSMFDPFKMSHSFIQNCSRITLQVSHHKKWKVKLFFSRRLKRFDGLTSLTLPPCYTTDLCHWQHPSCFSDIYGRSIEPNYRKYIDRCPFNATTYQVSRLWQGTSSTQPQPFPISRALCPFSSLKDVIFGFLLLTSVIVLWAHALKPMLKLLRSRQNSFSDPNIGKFN